MSATDIPAFLLRKRDEHKRKDDEKRKLWRENETQKTELLKQLQGVNQQIERDSAQLNGLLALQKTREDQIQILKRQTEGVSISPEVITEWKTVTCKDCLKIQQLCDNRISALCPIDRASNATPSFFGTMKDK